MIDRLDPKVDFVFKRIFGVEENKDVLIDFLNVMLRESEASRVTEIQILNPFIDKNALHDKLSILDVHARTADGKQVNIEIQLCNRYDIEKRTLYYWSKMYASQIEEGQQYKALKKTITINILNFNFLQNERYFNLFHLLESHTGLMLNDDNEIHFLELPKLQESNANLTDKLVKWSLFLKGIDNDKLELWEVIAMNEPSMQKAMGTLEFLSQDKEARRLYEMRQRALHDEASMIGGAKEEARREIAVKLLKRGTTISDTAEISGLTEAEVQKLKNEIH